MRTGIPLAALMLALVPLGAARADGVPTISPSALAQDATYYRNQLDAMKSQFDELAQQTSQAVRNARQLGNIDGLTNELREYTDLLNSDAAKTVLSEFYGIQSDAQNFQQLARQKLGQVFDLPRTDADIRQMLGESGASPGVVDSIASSNGLLLDGQDAILNSAQSLNQSAEQSAKAKQILDQRTADLAGLGDDNLAATMQLSTGVQIQQGYQLDQVVSELRAIRTEDVQKRLVDLQEQKRELEAQLARQQELARIRADTHTPVPLSSFGNCPMRLAPLFLIIGAVCASSAAIAEPGGVFDPAYQAESQRIQRAAAAACQSGNIAARGFCRDRKREELQRDNPRLRGTDAYCQANYASLGKGSLLDTADQLARERRQARYAVAFRGGEAAATGELSREDVEFEYRCVHDILARRGVRTGIDLGGSHIPDSEVCQQINCRAGQRPAAPSGGPLDGVTNTLKEFNSLFN